MTPNWRMSIEQHRVYLSFSLEPQTLLQSEGYTDMHRAAMCVLVLQFWANNMTPNQRTDEHKCFPLHRSTLNNPPLGWCAQRGKQTQQLSLGRLLCPGLVWQLHRVIGYRYLFIWSLFIQHHLETLLNRMRKKREYRRACYHFSYFHLGELSCFMSGDGYSFVALVAVAVFFLWLFSALRRQQ